jgi:HAD superfamily hydrolase (TIGR01490 family)
MTPPASRRRPANKPSAAGIDVVKALANKRIAITGGTGFVGTALIERLLRCVPDCEVVLLVRPGRRTTAEARTQRDILRNDCFDRLREELGDRFNAEMQRRVRTISGDVGSEGLALNDDGRTLLGSCDVVVHCAATVSFDAPFDSAVEVNLLGPARVATTLLELAPAFRASDAPLPHLISVSTAYVNSGHHGDAFEEQVTASRYLSLPKWQSEVDAARRTRSDLDAESRQPKRLSSFRKQARAELGAAGVALLSERTERLREDFVHDQLVEFGRARAQAIGWPDAYAFTKSLGEVALIDSKGALPVSIVRPSIVESALAEPRPGWIRGFRMAEPVIISYARGLLHQFPGVPEGVIDVIPVDLVAAAIIAVAASGGTGQEPSVYQIASGVRNPFRYGALVKLCEEWFTENPLYDEHGQPIVVPEWTFPGRGKVQAELRRVSRALALVDRVLNTMPIRGDLAERASNIEEQRTLAERALGYVELYGSYTETEARFRIDRSLQLFANLTQADQHLFAFDPIAIDWPHYIVDIHLPSIVTHSRARTSPRRRAKPDRKERALAEILTPEPRCVVFDLEQTIVNSNVVESYAWLATRHLAPLQRARVALELLAEGPRLLATDRRDRTDFLRSFYRRYENAPVRRVREDSWELFSDLLLTRSFPDALQRIRDHRALGHKTLLITGALDFVVEPMRPLFDEIVCASLGERDGKFTGELVKTSPTGEARAIMMEEWAESLGLSLAHTVAYADSTSDLPMLEAAGHPVAVNPEVKLAAIARRRGWPIELWERARGGPRYPLAVSMRGVGPRTSAPGALITGGPSS